MSAVTLVEARRAEIGWRWALAAWFSIHLAVGLFASPDWRPIIEPGWWLAVYLGHRLGKATEVTRAARAGGGE